MKWKLVVSLLAFLLVFGVAAQAQERHTVDIFAGYSYVRANPSSTGTDGFNLNGGSASIAYGVNNWLSGVADLGGYHVGSIAGFRSDSTMSTYLFGPRVSYRHLGRLTPFGQVLFGVARADANVFGTSSTQNAFAMTVGGGVDYQLRRHWAIRPVQVEYLMTRFNEFAVTGTQTQNNLRVSTGIVFHF